MNILKFIPKNLTNTVKKANFTWQTPSNIALVKYWGKKKLQIPKNTSISFTLNHCHTITSIYFTKNNGVEVVNFEMYFEGKKKEDFKPKIAQFFKRIQKYCPYIFAYDMKIYSKNSFPHSSGIASSASGLSAIAMCLMSLEQKLTVTKDSKNKLSEKFIHKKASFLARLGSGSASRSIEGPLVVWGKHPEIEGSSDLFGVPFPYKVHSVFNNYQDTILLVDKGKKQVSSTIGHNLMIGHPFAEQRFVQANENLSKLSKILQNGDVKSFINLVENEALTLHGMMLTSNPYFILMQPNTLEIINKIWLYRQQNNSNICFTLDAGANVHILYPKEEEVTIKNFIKTDLSRFCQNNQYIFDNIGLGAKKR